MKILLFDCTDCMGVQLQPFFPDYDVVLIRPEQGQLDSFTSTHNLNYLFQQLGTVDSIVFIPSTESGLDQKLLAQINFAMVGQHFLNSNGTITLTSGPSHCENVDNHKLPETINAAIEGFVRTSANDMQCGRRINAIWPSIDAYSNIETDTEVDILAKLYRTSIEAGLNGQVYAPDGDQTGILH